MKARGVKVEAARLLDGLSKMKRKGWQDGNMLEYDTGTEAKPAKNIIRPVWEIQSCFVHYVQDYIEETDNVSKVPVCVGRPRCPICKAREELYSIGTKEAKDQASKFRPSERHYWNVIPRWEYDWGGTDAVRFLILSFGKMARESLEEMVSDYGHPGDVEVGYDIVFEVFDQETGWGNHYALYPVKERSRSGSRITEELQVTPLTKDELDMELVSCDKYVTPPSEEELETFDEIFLIKGTKTRTSKKRRDAEEISSRKRPSLPPPEDEEESYFCFGDASIYDKKSSACGECAESDSCSRDIKKNRIQKLRAKKSVGKVAAKKNTDSLPF